VFTLAALAIGAATTAGVALTPFVAPIVLAPFVAVVLDLLALALPGLLLVCSLPFHH
jgi:hypothetical protein